MSDPRRQPGWDKQTVNGIAKEHYGSLGAMFEAHGWTKGEKTFGQIAPTLVVQSYGSVNAFDLAHRNGLERNYMLHPLAVLEDEQPKVLLTSYFGFTPWDWPCLTFTDKGRRDQIIEETRPGFLAVIYGSTSKQTAENEQGRLLGIYQCSHRSGPTDSFLSPEGLKRKKIVEKDPTSWSHAIEAVRAWRVPNDSAPLIASFAPDTYSPRHGTPISRYGAWLTPAEARSILDLDLVPEPTYWGREQVDSALAPARDALQPSKPGPVSQSSYMVGEAEGPKHLYMLRLEGNASHFLDQPCHGVHIIKVGFSKSPAIRCLAHNRALPACAFHWHVYKSTLSENRNPFPTSNAAKEGEQAMIRLLVESGKSLGGEFFLASPDAINRAWSAGIEAAENWKPL